MSKPIPAYHSAKIMQDGCNTEYQCVLDSYHKIYDRTGIALAFCGIAFPIILSQLASLSQIESWNTPLIIKAIIMVVSLLAIIFVIIQLGILMCGTNIPSLNTFDLIESRVDQMTEDQAAMWFAGIYIDMGDELRQIVNKKQRRFNFAIVILIIAIIIFSITVML